MATEIFDAPTFLAALVAALPSAKWEPLGLLDNEQCWRTFPVADKPFAVLVRSSIGPSGLCDGAGEDSIRAYCVTEDGDYFGGKTRRWVPRTTNWRTMTADMIHKLTEQIERIVPCPSCGEMVKPFVVKRPGPNKNRPFVKCCNDACEKQAFIWCDTDDAPPAPAPAPRPAPVATATTDAPDSLATDGSGTPLCPTHGAMERMPSGKGWRCTQNGGWDSRAKCFKGCNVVQFDDRSKCKDRQPAPPAPAPVVVPPRSGVTAPAPMPAPPAPAPSGKLGTNGPRMVTCPASALRAALAALDDDNPGEVARILNDLLK